MSIENFREDTRAWLDANCPASMRDRPVHFEDAFDIYNTDDAKSWLNACDRNGLGHDWAHADGIRNRSPKSGASSENRFGGGAMVLRVQ